VGKPTSAHTRIPNMTRKCFDYIPRIAFATGKLSHVPGGITQLKLTSSAPSLTSPKIPGASTATCIDTSLRIAKWKLQVSNELQRM